MKGEKRVIWKGFFVNMLGVILAIILTFGVNALWELREEKKRTKEMLILVRNELKESKDWFQSHEKLIKKDRYVYKQILKAEGQFADIPKDTLNVYQSHVLSWSDYLLTTSAWQIFQNSEMIQKMTEKELVIRITQSYFLIDKIRETIMSEYWDKKKKLNTFLLDPYQFFDALMKNQESVFFMEVFSMEINENGFWTMFPLIDAFLDYTILLLDKHGDYRYDMDEKDNEINAFLEARIDSFFQKKDTIK
jgi:hypothetical protein